MPKIKDSKAGNEKTSTRRKVNGGNGAAVAAGTTASGKKPRSQKAATTATATAATSTRMPKSSASGALKAAGAPPAVQAVKMPVKEETGKRPAGRQVTEQERSLMIAEAAYLRAERRGFVGGDPQRDWLEAEVEVNASLEAR